MEQPSKGINILDLKLAFDRIVDRLKNIDNIDYVRFPIDLYNVINAADWDVSNNVNDVVMVGSLFDDISEIQKLVKDKDRFCTTVDFDRLANILRAIGAIIANG